MHLQMIPAKSHAQRGGLRWVVTEAVVQAPRRLQEAPQRMESRVQAIPVSRDPTISLAETIPVTLPLARSSQSVADRSPPSLF